MAGSDTYEAYAVQYAYRAERRRHETFITNAWTDPLHETLQPISYYVWAIVNEERTIVHDVGEMLDGPHVTLASFSRTP